MFWVGEVWRRGGSSWVGWETITTTGQRLANAVVFTFASADEKWKSQSRYSERIACKPYNEFRHVALPHRCELAVSHG